MTSTWMEGFVREAMREDIKYALNDLRLPDIPEPDLPEESGDILFDSERDYMEQLDAYREFREEESLSIEYVASPMARIDGSEGTSIAL